MLDRNPQCLAAFSCLALAVVLAQGPVSEPETPEARIARDLGLDVLELHPLFERIPKEILTDVGKRSSLSAKELQGTELYRAVVRGRDGVERPCEVAVVQLGGSARGGRIAFARREGRLVSLSLWGAHDFDADPTNRWSVFLGQFSPWEGDPAFSATTLSAREAEELAKRLEKPKDDEQRLGRALLRQRLAMRANGFLAGLLHRKVRPKTEWLPELRRGMEDLAAVSRDLTPLLGPDGAARHEEQARELAAAYTAMEELLIAEPNGDLTAPEKRVSATCSTCHDTQHEGKDWTATMFERRTALGLAEPALQIGYDLVPAFGDDGKISREIAQRFRAGVLLLEAAKR